MFKKTTIRLVVAIVGTLLVSTVAHGQTGRTTGGSSQTPTNNTSSGPGGGAPATMPPGTSTTAGGLTLPSLDFTQGTTGAGGGTTGAAGGSGRGSSRRTGSRTGTSIGGLMGGLTGASSLGAGGRGGQSAMQSNRQTDRRAQYITRIEFAPPAVEPAATIPVREAVEQSLAAIIPSGASVTMDGSTAILTGSVSSTAERQVAERMLLLEPGVRTVRNDLEVRTN